MKFRSDQDAADFYAGKRFKTLEFEEQTYVRGLIRRGLLRFERVDHVTWVRLPAPEWSGT